MPRRKKGRKSRGPKQLSKSITRIHEAGHVVAAWFDPYLPKVKKATVREDENSLGFVLIKWKDHHGQTQGIEETLALIRFSLGGRVAEELCGGPKMYGASSDLFEANLLVHHMVMGLGMSEEFGHTMPMFLAMGDRTKQLADDAMMKVMAECTAETRKRLGKKKQQILAVAHAFQDRKTLKTKHLKAILGPRPKRKFSRTLPEKKTNARRK